MESYSHRCNNLTYDAPVWVEYLQRNSYSHKISSGHLEYRHGGESCGVGFGWYFSLFRTVQLLSLKIRRRKINKIKTEAKEVLLKDDRNCGTRKVNRPPYWWLKDLVVEKSWWKSFSGHGCFRNYLWRLKIIDDPACKYRGGEIDDEQQENCDCQRKLIKEIVNRS